MATPRLVRAPVAPALVDCGGATRDQRPAGEGEACSSTKAASRPANLDTVDFDMRAQSSDDARHRGLHAARSGKKIPHAQMESRVQKR
jgi:hypothetical protein